MTLKTVRYKDQQMTKEKLWKTFRKPGGLILSLKKNNKKNDFLEAKKTTHKGWLKTSAQHKALKQCRQVVKLMIISALPGQV